MAQNRNTVDRNWNKQPRWKRRKREHFRQFNASVCLYISIFYLLVVYTICFDWTPLFISLAVSFFVYSALFLSQSALLHQLAGSIFQLKKRFSRNIIFCLPTFAVCVCVFWDNKILKPYEYHRDRQMNQCNANRCTAFIVVGVYIAYMYNIFDFFLSSSCTADCLVNPMCFNVWHCICAMCVDSIVSNCSSSVEREMHV